MESTRKWNLYIFTFYTWMFSISVVFRSVRSIGVSYETTAMCRLPKLPCVWHDSFGSSEKEPNKQMGLFWHKSPWHKSPTRHKSPARHKSPCTRTQEPLTQELYKTQEPFPFTRTVEQLAQEPYKIHQQNAMLINKTQHSSTKGIVWQRPLITSNHL